MGKGKFWAVGVGPGDPELLTLKAARMIEESDVIAAPKSGAGKNVALEIAGKYLEGKPVVEVEMPMIRDEKALQSYHEAACDTLAELLDSGKTVAFLTLGDPGIYSTVMYLHRMLGARGYETGVIPGVPSFCAVAASLNEPLCERGQALHVIPASYPNLDRALALDGCKVLMKSGKSMAAVREKLLGTRAKAVECATMPEERVYRSMEEVPEKPSYFSVVVIPADEQES